MFSVIKQEKTIVRDRGGASVYRRAYLCDGVDDVERLPLCDAPGSLCYVSETADIYILDHTPKWCCVGKGCLPWKI